ncbi:hypothetical protein FHS92_001771 [Sphingobium subterraneum]|uniref:Uncharacterized protein n=1 Tax=Sphingobium subterraneum TaxID=627688 RepID=A0A841J122_9SPHN|nr:hypothetical protein [Sphingobium subterraneum]
MIRSPFALQHLSSPRACPPKNVTIFKECNNCRFSAHGSQPCYSTDALTPWVGFRSSCAGRNLGRSDAAAKNPAEAASDSRADSFSADAIRRLSQAIKFGEDRRAPPRSSISAILCGTACHMFILSNCKIITLDAFRNIHTVLVTAHRGVEPDNNNAGVASEAKGRTIGNWPTGLRSAMGLPAFALPTGQGGSPSITFLCLITGLPGAVSPRRGANEPKGRGHHRPKIRTIRRWTRESAIGRDVT